MPVPFIWLGCAALTGGAVGFGAASATDSVLKHAIIAAIAWWIWVQFIKPMVGA